MDLTLAGVTLHVSDVDRSLAFYQKLPGAQVMFHMLGRFALLRFGTGRLGLLSDRKRPFHLELECTDLDATYTKFHELNVAS
jgi:catechol 2,3-dioxygenase-like lactoylglutathione lyase family enzyme